MRMLIAMIGLQILTGTAVAGSQAENSAEAEVRAVMAILHSAALAGDTDKTASLMTEQYIQTDISGHFEEKAEWLNTYSRPLAALIKDGKFHFESYDEREVQIRIYGDTAIVMGLLDLKGSGARWGGAQLSWIADPDAHPAVLLRFTRVFVRSNGRWLLAAIHNAMMPPTTSKSQ